MVIHNIHVRLTGETSLGKKKEICVMFLALGIIYLFVYLKVRALEKERHREKETSTHWSIPQMTSTTRAGPEQTQELQLGLQCGYQKSRYLGQLSLVFPGH